MAGGQLVMAAYAGVGSVANRAVNPVDGRELAVEIVLPASRMRCGTHNQMASDALIFCGAGRGGGVRGSHHDVGVADEAFRARRRSFLVMVDPEAFGVEIRLDVAGMTAGNAARLGIDMTGLAIRHPEIRPNRLVVIVTSDTIDHLGQRQILETGALRYCVVASRAVQVVLFAGLEVRDVREFQVHEFSGDHV